LSVRFAVLVNPNNRNVEPLTRDLQATASAIGAAGRNLRRRQHSRH
jgi:hypothetical protein